MSDPSYPGTEVFKKSHIFAKRLSIDFLVSAIHGFSLKIWVSLDGSLQTNRCMDTAYAPTLVNSTLYNILYTVMYSVQCTLCPDGKVVS